MRLLLFLTAATAIAGEFATSLVGSYPFTVSAVAADSAGNTYVVGSRRLQERSDVFLTKLDPNGNILFTNTFGGSGTDSGATVTVDADGNIYIGGTAGSADFPVSYALQSQPGVGRSGFIMKISNDGATVLYSTYFGGTLGASSISALALDGKGNLYVTGNTNSSDFPQSSGLPTVQFTSSNGALASGTMVAEISAAGDKILYSGLILTGPNDNLTGRTGIAVDAAGNAYIAGNTANPNLPVSSPSVPAHSGPFVAKVNAGGAGFGYLTYIPGLSSVSAVTVNAAGNAYIAGYNQTAPNESFPTTPGSLQPTLNGEFADGFLAELNLAGSAFVWATFLPGGCGAWPLSIAVDAGGKVWSTGNSAINCGVPNNNGWSNGPEFLIGISAAGTRLAYSALYPSGTVAESVVVDASGVVHVGGSAGFVSAVSPGGPPVTEIFGFQNAFGGSLTAQISPGELIAIYGPGIGPASAVAATPANGFYPTTLGGVQAAINGVNVPLLYVSANQINAVAPMELASNAAATVQVTNGTTGRADYPAWVVPAAPVANPVVLNQDGTANSQTNPAHAGSIVTFWATGWQSNFPLADGQVQSVANNDACTGGCQAGALFIPVPMCLGFCFAEPVKPKLGGAAISIAGTVAYAGAAPGFAAGVTQFNVQLESVPASAGTNLFSLYVTSSLTGSTVVEGVYIAP